MVEHTLRLSAVFSSLADATRRDILQRLAATTEMTVSELAAPYKVSLAAISKHLRVLENAQLVGKRKQGKQQMVHIVPHTVADAQQYFARYERTLGERMQRLDNFIEK